jgi:multimeric flavodoxin WrbA
MKAIVISDSDHQSALSRQLHTSLLSHIKEFDIEEISVSRNSLAHCVGCFGCWIKTPGECIFRDDIGRINRAVMNSDVVFYLTPVVLGQFSVGIKAVVDRGLPNMLPFFIVRPDGSTMHPARYTQYPAHIFIGYGDTVSAEDAALFVDITKKHRRGADAFIYDPATDLASQLKSFRLEKKEGLL